MVLLTVMLLGGFEARLASGAPLRLPKKAQALLAYLGVRSGQGQSRDKLAALLWGDKDDAQARDGLRHALAALRRALGRPSSRILQIEGQTLALDPQRVEVDVAAFERLVAEKSPPALEQAAALYGGDLLLGFNLNEPAFEEWLVAERERLRELAVDGLTRLLGDQTRGGTTERAIQTAVRLLALDHLQEGVHRALMRLYARQGRRGAALKHYQLCVSALRRELGTEPEAETKRLYQELLRRPAESTPAETRERPRMRSTPGASSAVPDLPAPETPMFGRQAELERLRARLDEASNGRGQTATVLGEAGIGKTRLVGALAAEAESRGYRILIGRCHESDSILPFGPWVDAFRTGAVAAAEDALGALHPTRRSELARLLPEAARPGLPRASDSALPVFESVTALVEQLAAQRPLMLLLEDLHWADEMSLRLLAFVGRRVAPWPALLVVTARDEELPDAAMARRTLEELSRASAATAMVLLPLSRADTAQLTRAFTRVGSEAATLARLEAQVWAAAEGNPFVAVEMIRALDQKGLEADGAGIFDARALPTGVLDLVARRLDRLSPLGQELAAVAAVIGRQFDFALLSTAAGIDERAAAQAVEEMVRHRVLQAVGNELDFTHDRVRGVVYDRLLPPRRQVLHRAVAEALEAVGPSHAAGRFDDRVEQLAHHAVRGEAWDTAVRYLRQAGVKAAGRSALQAARAWFEQALAGLELLPHGASTHEQGFEIRLELRPVLTQLGEVRGALDRLREADALAERLNDDRRRGQVRAFMTNVHALLGELDEAVATGACALEIAERLGDPGLLIPTRTYLETTHFWRGDHARVVELARDNLDRMPAELLCEHLGSTAPASVYDRTWLVLSLAELGRFAEADAPAAEAIRLARPTEHGFTVSLAYRAACTLLLLKGAFAPARALIAQWAEVARTHNVMLHLAYATAASAWNLAQLGETNEAIARIDDGDQFVEALDVRRIVGNRAWTATLRGRACLLLGRLDRAGELADRALESSKTQAGFRAHALQLLGDIVTHPDRFDVAAGESYYRKSLALAEPRGMRPLVAHCHFGLGRLHRRAGSSSQAREHLATATAAYRQLGMDYWLAEAQAAST